jgi:hypothetical protein
VLNQRCECSVAPGAHCGSRTSGVAHGFSPSVPLPRTAVACARFKSVVQGTTTGTTSVNCARTPWDPREPASRSAIHIDRLRPGK